MRRAGLALLGFLLLLAAARAGEVRRPVPVVKIGGRDYVRITDVAVRLKLSLHLYDLGRRAVLTDANHRIELTAGGRYGGLEAIFDGLEIFLGDPVVARAGGFFVSQIDLEHRLVPLLHPTWGGPPPAPPHVIVIDPGHGGDDSGFENRRLGLKEKTFTLDTAFRLKRLLEARGYRVILTRTSDAKLDRDHDTDLRRRGEVAVLAHADLFISIHFNSGAPDPRPKGTEVYTFCPEHQSSTESSLARRDDSEPNRAFPYASPVNRFDFWSAIFAHAVHESLIAGLHTEDRGEKLRHLGVLRPLTCPGILVESAFLSNDAEAHRIATPAFRDQIAQAMAAGIDRYAREMEALRPRLAAAPPAPSAPAPASGGYQPPTRP